MYILSIKKKIDDAYRIVYNNYQPDATRKQFADYLTQQGFDYNRKPENVINQEDKIRRGRAIKKEINEREKTAVTPNYPNSLTDLILDVASLGLNTGVKAAAREGNQVMGDALNTANYAAEMYDYGSDVYDVLNGRGFNLTDAADVTDLTARLIAEGYDKGVIENIYAELSKNPKINPELAKSFRNRAIGLAAGQAANIARFLPVAGGVVSLGLDTKQLIKEIEEQHKEKEDNAKRVAELKEQLKSGNY